MKFRIIVLFSFVVAFSFLCGFPAAWSEEVGAVLEEPEPELPQVTLKMSGNGCEPNLNESELLRVKGVLGVDIESKPGKMIVTYDPTKTGVQKILGAVGKKEGGCTASEEVANVKK